VARSAGGGRRTRCGCALGTKVALPSLPATLAKTAHLEWYNLGVPAMPIRAGRQAGERTREPRGLSPLRKVRTPQGRPLGVSREGETPGKCHRKQTADVPHTSPFGNGVRGRARVKRWGKSSPPRLRGLGHGKPRSERGRIGRRLRVARLMPPGRPQRWMAPRDRIRPIGRFPAWFVCDCWL